MIGRRFEDRTLAADMKTWPFHVVNQAGRPMVRVTQGGEVKLYHPEEISAMVLGALRAAAAAYLGAEVTRCVVTVPAHFGDAQRLATKDAATIAGLDVTRVINEPTAGALAYGLGEPEGDERNVLIYDLGGGTFDVTVLTIEEGVFEVRATCGDTHLGGQDFDTRLCAHLAEEFVRKHPDCDLVADKKAMLRLRTACDKAKRQLSGATECSIQLDNLQTGVDFSTSLSRSSFEVLNEDLFRLTLTLVDRVLKDAEVDKKDIHEVVLVGGSTRIPMVQRLLREFFDGKELNSSLNPDEAVARGAALQAAILNGDLSERVQDLVLLDVTPLSLGVDIVEGITSTIVERNSAIPIKNTVTFYTATDNQTNVVVTVFEGERMMSKNNTELGSFTLNGIPPGQAETQAVDVTFEIDSDGILNVTAVVKSTSKEMKVTIAGNRGRLSADHIEKLVQEAALYLEQDKKSKEIALAKSALEYYCLHMTSRAKKSWIPASVKQIILELCTETLQWLASNQNVSKESLGEKLQELKQMFPSLK